MESKKNGGLKRLLSLFLVLVMCLGLLPVGVFAGNVNTWAGFKEENALNLNGHFTATEDYVIDKSDITSNDFTNCYLDDGGFQLTFRNGVRKAHIRITNRAIVDTPNLINYLELKNENQSYIVLKCVGAKVNITTSGIPAADKVLIAFADNEEIKATAKLSLMSGLTDNGYTLMWDGLVAYAVKTATITWTDNTDGTATVTGTTTTSFVKDSTVTFSVTAAAGYDITSANVTADGATLSPVEMVGNTYTYSFKANADTEIVIGKLQHPLYSVTLPISETADVAFKYVETTGDDYATVGNDLNNKIAKVYGYTATGDYAGDKVQFTVTPRVGYTVKAYTDGSKGVYANGKKLTAKTEDGKEYYELSNLKEDQIITIDTEETFYKLTVIDETDNKVLATFPQVAAGANLLSVLNTLIQPNFTFNSWYIIDGESKTDVEDQKMTSDLTVYAKTTPNTVTNGIKYDLNGAGGTAPTAQNKTYGRAVRLTGSIPADIDDIYKTNYTFKGWALSSGGDPVYQTNDMFSEEITESITLYAVWELNTYTMYLPTGTGFSIINTNVSGDGNKVFSPFVTASVDEEGKNDTAYRFLVKVDRAYANAAPIVKVGPVDGTAAKLTPSSTRTPNADGSYTYPYMIENIDGDRVITVEVTENSQVTYKMVPLDEEDQPTDAITVYMVQGVELIEDGDHKGWFKISPPVAPELDGYAFDGWYETKELVTEFNFDAYYEVAQNVYAKMKLAEREVTIPAEAEGYTDHITLVNDDEVDTTETPDETGEEKVTVQNGDDVTFTLTVREGYDASNMIVGANGLALAPIEIKSVTFDADAAANAGETRFYDGEKLTVYTYLVSNVKEPVDITVVGIARQKVKITYLPNAEDDVSLVPGQQLANYYIEYPEESAPGDNSYIAKLLPVREGYEFLGWSTKADVKYEELPTEDDEIVTKWAEGDDSFAFIKAADIAASAGVISQFKADTVLYAVWNEDTTSAISWKLTPGATTDDPKYVDDVDATITIYVDSDANGEYDEGTDVLFTGEQMVATDTYFMALPKVYSLDTENYEIGNEAKVNKEYTVQWMYKDPVNDWTDSLYASADVVRLTPDLYGYSFKAIVRPVIGITSPFLKAATYTNEATGDLVTDVYTTYIVTLPTKNVMQKETIGTTLVIEGAVDEAADVSIAGATPFNAEIDPIGAHWAQFEQENITLVATVTEDLPEGSLPGTTPVIVNTGIVDFYLVGETEDVLIGTAYVDAATAKATIEYTVDDYNAVKTAENNYLDFYATYRANDGYAEESSKTNALTASGKHIVVDPGVAEYERVYIMSRTIDTPIITDTDWGTSDWNTEADFISTKNASVNGIEAGIKHKFELVQNNLSEDGVTMDTASVIAIDGRLVPADAYIAEWFAYNEDITFENDTRERISGLLNPLHQEVSAELLDFGGEGSYYNRNGSEIWVALYTNGFYFNNVESKKLVISEKQDVTIVVTTDPTEQYQRCEVRIGATVAGKDDTTLEFPTGTVQFFYSVDSGTTWTAIGDPAELVNGYAEIVTCDLPVTAGTNIYEELLISATYSGDNSFKTLEKDAAEGVTTANETIYSSAVYTNAAVENKVIVSDPTDRSNGIVIAIEGDKSLTELLKANEPNVNLTMSDVYTLDYAQNKDAWAYLPYTNGDDANVYTITWQYCDNYKAYVNDENYPTPNDWPWETMGSDLDICQVTVADNVAYRAMITVLENDCTRASWENIDQDVNDGRHVYYSNILAANEGEGQITVNVNTSKVEDGYEGIVDGETVTVNTFISGAVGTTPIANVTATIVDEGGNEVFNENSDNVNGFVSFDWDTAADGVEPGYYTLTVKATFSNGYEANPITRELIVRDDDYTINVTGTEKTYNGKTQGVTATISDMDIEAELADKFVVVYYYTDEDMKDMVEPKNAGTYYYKAVLGESAFWTEKFVSTVTTTDDEGATITKAGTFTILPREVEVVDLVAQAKVYDGTSAANLQEIILNDSAVDANGVATGTKGLINGDSLYAIGTGALIDEEGEPATDAGAVKLTATNVVLKGDDAANYKLKEITTSYTGYTEDFTILRNQLKGDIADATYRYGTTAVPAEDVCLIDQQGNAFTDYTLTYYYHNGEGVEKVVRLGKLGMYTVVATATDAANYKGGASQVVYVAVKGDEVDQTPVTPAPSATIAITNTVELFGDEDNTGIVATASNGEDVTVTYNGSATVPTDAGRYLVKATATTGDAAYGLYTIVKANQAATLTAEDVTYDSALQNGYKPIEGVEDEAEVWYTWVGGTIQGVSYTAPTEVGTYVVTAHMNETANYAASEVSAVYTIKPAELTVTATSLGFHHYGSFPVLTASYSGLATGGVAKDTSLRDVQIPAELIFNDNDYSNDTLDQVGNYPITAVAALARNYNVTYVDGLFTVTDEIRDDALTIYGMPYNADGETDIVYYGDKIQLYAYGSQNEDCTIINESSQLFWTVKKGDFTGDITIDAKSGILDVQGVGGFTVTLTRGIGAQKISTTWTATAKKQELKVNVPNVDKLYSGVEQTYDGAVTTLNAMLKSVSDVATVPANNTRTNIGSQVTNYTVKDDVNYYQSETYGGLYTINDKDVTVAPNAQNVTYGDSLTIADEKAQCNVTGEVTDATPATVEALTGYQVASIRELYTNLDVANAYEILAVGTENINYNVHYTTAPTANSVTVAAKSLTIDSGVYANTIGSTDGSKLPEGVYPESGAEITETNVTKTGSARMYGEPNQVMGFVVDGLIDGDSMADLADFNAWLTEYTDDAHRLISRNANVTYLDKTAPIDDTHTVGEYAITEDDTHMSFANYTETYTSGNQDIYQRPVELKETLPVHELSTSTTSTELQKVLMQNITAEKLNGEGGLALRLKHTVQDLGLTFAYQISYNGTDYNAEQSSFDNLSGVMKLKVIVRVTNPNYYAADKEIVLNVSTTKYVIEIVEFKQNYATVNLYECNADDQTRSLAWFGEDNNVLSGNESNAMVCKIYNRVDGKTKYVDYSANTPVVNAKMIKGDTVGRYTINYGTLYGSFRMFAVADDDYYFIIDNT